MPLLVTCVTEAGLLITPAAPGPRARRSRAQHRHHGKPAVQSLSHLVPPVHSLPLGHTPSQTRERAMTLFYPSQSSGSRDSSPTVPMPTLRGARLDKIFSGSKCGCLSLEGQPCMSPGTSRYDKLWEKGV